MWSIQKFKKISLFSLLKNMWAAQMSNKYLVRMFLSFIQWNKNATSERMFLIRDEDIKAKWCVLSWNYIIAHSCLTRQVFLGASLSSNLRGMMKILGILSSMIVLFCFILGNRILSSLENIYLGENVVLGKKRLNLNQPH